MSKEQILRFLFDAINSDRERLSQEHEAYLKEFEEMSLARAANDRHDHQVENDQSRRDEKRLFRTAKASKANPPALRNGLRKKNKKH